MHLPSTSEAVNVASGDLCSLLTSIFTLSQGSDPVLRSMIAWCRNRGIFDKVSNEKLQAAYTRMMRDSLEPMVYVRTHTPIAQKERDDVFAVLCRLIFQEEMGTISDDITAQAILDEFCHHKQVPRRIGSPIRLQWLRSGTGFDSRLEPLRQGLLLALHQSPIVYRDRVDLLIGACRRSNTAMFAGVTFDSLTASANKEAPPMSPAHGRKEGE